MWNTPLSAVEQQLSPGERLLWCGQPRRGIKFRGSDGITIPFSLMWCGFAVFWEVSVIKSGAPFFFKLWGIPFVLVGLYMVIGRFFVDAYARERTFYGVTNERVIIIGGITSRETKSLALRTLADVSLSEHSDGSGTITFGPQYPYPADGTSRRRYRAPAFELIERAKEVYDIIRHAQKSAS